ncbi:MAG: L,D-transpeptidase family protein [Paracoccaceae bacterium]
MTSHLRIAAVALLVVLPGAAASAATSLPPGPERVLAAVSVDTDIAPFYEQRGGAPLWEPAGGPLAPEPLLAALDAAPSHALPAARYGVDALRARIADVATPEDAAALERALSRSLARYVGDMAAGVLRPNRVDSEIHVFPQRPEPHDTLNSAAAAPDFAEWLASLAPQGQGYERLRALYADLVAQERAGGWRAHLGDGGTLRRGDRGPRVARLRERLAELGDPAAPAEAPEAFDAQLEITVKTFQRRHGLNADGIVGRRTFAALGADAGERLRQVAVNLERRRWGPRDLEPRHVLANIPDYSMRFVDGERVMHSARVVVGQRRHQTPEFSDEMTHMVVNPTWHVPRSIATEEILPELQEDPGYLAEQNMRLVSDMGVPDDPSSHDFTQYSSGSFPYRVKQRPGPSNALGRVKFMFPNEFSIYMHDTPSKNLFRRDGRAFSHGCVRVENPFEFAYALLEGQVDDPASTFHRYLDSRREIYVNFDRPVPVHIVYRTAWVEPDGQPQFRADVYGRDERVWSALEAAGLAPGL